MCGLYYYRKPPDKTMEVIMMCSVGDSFDIDMEGKLPVKNYVCKDCGNKFKGIGKNVKCPSCQSSNVAEA
jgi:predicted Zn-ribbon and HTH transcriptional regulator